MKHLYSYAVLLLMAVAPLALTSCDDDPDYYWWNDWDWGGNYNNRPDDRDADEEDFWVQMAQTLAGQWRGDMRAYQLDEKGNAIDSLDLSTDIEFKQANSRAVYGTVRSGTTSTPSIPTRLTIRVTSTGASILQTVKSLCSTPRTIMP